MIMWAMSDRAHPALAPHDGGLRRPHLPLRQRRRASRRFVKFHWRPRLGLQSMVWDEAVKIAGADPDFHRRDLWEAIDARRLPGVGARRAGVRRGVRRRSSTSTSSTRPSSSPRSSCRCRSIGRLVLDRNRRQLLRRDRAGRVLHAERRAGHRLHATIRCCRAASSPTSTPSSSGSAAPTSRRSRSTRRSARSRTSSATATCRCRSPKGRVNYEPNSLDRRRRGPREDPAGGFTHASPSRWTGAKRARPRRDASPTTTARRGCSTSARPPIEQAHIVGAFVFELAKVRDPGDPRRGWSATCATSTRTSRSASPTGSACRCRRPPAPPSSRAPTCPDRPRSAS